MKYQYICKQRQGTHVRLNEKRESLHPSER